MESYSVKQYGSGTCQQTSSCTTTGFTVASYCPNDPSSVECCVTASCSTSAGASGTCINTGDTCSGNFVAGVCPGPSDIEVSLGSRAGRCRSEELIGRCSVVCRALRPRRRAVEICPALTFHLLKRVASGPALLGRGSRRSYRVAIHKLAVP